MDYQNFVNRDVAYKMFVDIRKDLLNSIDNGTFDDDFTEVCTRAMTNNPVAQDLVAYFYNRGVPGHLQPNYELYMSWEILAGANGNEFAIDKLEFFINPVLDQIVGNEEIIATALRHRNITKDNALYVISNLICEGMADELKLDPKKLIKVQNDKPSRYSPEKNRPFLDAMQKSQQKVVDFLMS